MSHKTTEQEFLSQAARNRSLTKLLDDFAATMAKKPMLFFRKKRAFVVSIEYEGELPSYAHLATSPEIFRVYAVSAGAAQRAAVRDWADKYQASPRLITKILVRNA